MSKIIARQPRVLVLCVALNFYDLVYARNIESHRRYADRCDYSYKLVRWPVLASVHQSVWLKVPLIEAALTAGWDWVLFVDADCEIRPSAPRIETLADPEASVFLAPGFSGNPNSGVIVCCNRPEARAFFSTVIANAGKSVPEEDWGENGHIIHFAKHNSAFKAIDRAWNNNADPGMNDYIRHYSAGGPMRPLYRGGVASKAAQLVSRLIQKLRKLAGANAEPKATIDAWLARTTKRIATRNPATFKVIAEPPERIGSALHPDSAYNCSMAVGIIQRSSLGLSRTDRSGRLKASVSRLRSRCVRRSP